MKTYVLYHGPQCCDGFAAAVVARIVLGDDDVEYIPMGYSSAMPEIEPGSVVYMLDYSRPPQEVYDLAKRGVSVTVIDHHKTALERIRAWWDANPVLQDHPDVDLEYILDLDHSGAVLTWWHFYPRSNVPVLLQYIEDRDLWRWGLPHSREINARIASLLKDFSTWTSCLRYDAMGLIDDFVPQGEAILDFQRTQLDSLIGKVHIQGDETWPSGRFAIVNSPVLQSELGNEILERMPEVDVAAIWYEDADGSVRTSLRSRPDGPDVSDIAKQYGGGGHPNAAGFRTNSRWW